MHKSILYGKILLMKFQLRSKPGMWQIFGIGVLVYACSIAPWTPCTHSAHAETIFLKTGGKIKANIIKETPEYIVADTSVGTLTFYRFELLDAKNTTETITESPDFAQSQKSTTAKPAQNSVQMSPRAPYESGPQPEKTDFTEPVNQKPPSETDYVDDSKESPQKKPEISTANTTAAPPENTTLYKAQANNQTIESAPAPIIPQKVSIEKPGFPLIPIIISILGLGGTAYGVFFLAQFLKQKNIRARALADYHACRGTHQKNQLSTSIACIQKKLSEMRADTNQTSKIQRDITTLETLAHTAEEAKKKIDIAKPIDFFKAARGSIQSAKTVTTYVLGVYPPWEEAPKWYQVMVEKYGS